MNSNTKHNETQWSDIDKVKFYGIGTGMYTGITIALHPINVVKTRQQILSGVARECSSISNTLISKVPRLYRGLGIILVLAIPARGIYISTLENSREIISNELSKNWMNINKHNSNPSPMIASISGGLAGGLASMASQTIVVPMDVISQRQMVMNDASYSQRGTVTAVISEILRRDGYRGLFRGFGMSLFTSLPVGSIWWGTYSGCQGALDNVDFFRAESITNDAMFRGMLKQIIAGLSAACVAATMTQPLDVVKTVIQVDCTNKKTMGIPPTRDVFRGESYADVTRELFRSSGFRGFFRGIGPRIMSMGLWGTVLSSAYEYLRHISRKDYDFNFNFLLYSS